MRIHRGADVGNGNDLAGMAKLRPATGTPAHQSTSPGNSSFASFTNSPLDIEVSSASRRAALMTKVAPVGARCEHLGAEAHDGGRYGRRTGVSSLHRFAVAHEGGARLAGVGLGAGEGFRSACAPPGCAAGAAGRCRARRRSCRDHRSRRSPRRPRPPGRDSARSCRRISWPPHSSHSRAAAEEFRAARHQRRVHAQRLEDALAQLRSPPARRRPLP